MNSNIQLDKNLMNKLQSSFLSKHIKKKFKSLNLVLNAPKILKCSKQKNIDIKNYQKLPSKFF